MPRNPARTRRLDDIASLAEEVADTHCQTGPVQPELILERLGITLSFANYGDHFDGMLEWADQSFHVYCNEARVERRESPRARFTLGHELGHYFIDEHRNALREGRAPAHPSRCEFESKNPVEEEADVFAASLLMPRGRFLREAKRAQTGLGGILALAQTFKTSVTSTAIRYVKSNLGACTVIKWDVQGYAWKHLSTDTFKARYFKTLEERDKVPPKSATARALAGEMAPARGYFETGATASTWFPNVDPSSDRNVVMIEQAVSLGRFGALTVLYPDQRS